MTPAMWYFMFLIFISFNTKGLFANDNSGLDLGQPTNGSGRGEEVAA
jgi:hypothetical protein